jgi:hypothetical protein
MLRQAQHDKAIKERAGATFQKSMKRQAWPFEKV